MLESEPHPARIERTRRGAPDHPPGFARSPWLHPKPGDTKTHDGTAGKEAGSKTDGTARLWCARC
jgi:hypothetical protein